ncbi:hypothetical protein [Cellulomonas soli]
MIHQVTVRQGAQGRAGSSVVSLYRVGVLDGRLFARVRVLGPTGAGPATTLRVDESVDTPGGRITLRHVRLPSGQGRGAASFEMAEP